MSRWIVSLLPMVACLAVGPALAASFTPGLLDGLRHGGYVLVMRHASSPSTPPDEGTADPENAGLEQQLDEQGRATAENMGRAFQSLHIPIGDVYSSPTYRARETVKLAHFGTPKLTPELGDQGQSMARIQGPGPAAWLRAKVTEMPAPGYNDILVTHMPNIAAAFPAQAQGLGDGETLIFKPDSKGQTKFLAAIPITDWGGRLDLDTK